MRYLAILWIILTSTMCFTIAGKRPKCGTKVRASNCDCTSKTAGELKQGGGKLFFCDGNDWKALQFETPLGSRNNPGYSCKDLLDIGGQTADGVYWITLTDRREAFPVYCDMAGGGWTMIFKAVTGANQLAQDAYKSADTYAEFEMDALNVTSKYPNDYKNRIVLNWGAFGASEARVVLYKGVNAVKDLKFIAKRSDKLNWFQFNKLDQNNLPWNDLATAPRNIFQIDGSPQRSFYISSVHAGCPNDLGWMVITGPVCDWEKHYLPRKNVVLYSKQPGRTNWNQYSNVGVADTLVVFLR
ncbi:uncharacterized protein LOC144636779 isoform X2 [Oculina patagonica]